MIKLVIVGRRAPDKTRQAAHLHMRVVHGPMVFAPPPDAGPMPSYYAQNAVFEDEGALPQAWRAERDFVTEVGFDDYLHLRAATSTPYYLTRLRPDEPNFVDPPSVRAAPTRAESASGAQGPDAARLFVFLKLRGDAGEFARALGLARDEWADAAIVTAQASDVALAPDGRPAPFDRVERLSFADRAGALDFVAKRFAAFARRLAPHVEPGESFALLADHYSIARLRAEPGVQP